MPKSPDDHFCCVDDYKVLIPYRDLMKLVEVAKKVEVIEHEYVRLQEQYTAIRGMFSECLDLIREIREFVGNS